MRDQVCQDRLQGERGRAAFGAFAARIAPITLRIPARPPPQQAYNHGVVVIRCPGCEVLHLMADRLGWFADQKGKGVDVESLMRDKGETVRAFSNRSVQLAMAGHAKEAGGGAGAEAAAETAGAGPAAPADGMTEADLLSLDGVMELTEADIRVLQSEGSSVKPDGGAPGGGAPGERRS